MDGDYARPNLPQFPSKTIYFVARPRRATLCADGEAGEHQECEFPARLLTVTTIKTDPQSELPAGDSERSCSLALASCRPLRGNK
jgi:hypothetical protein